VNVVSRGPTRSAGATVILVDGALVAYLARGDRQLTTFLPEGEPMRSKAARAIARTLVERASANVGDDEMRGMLIEEVDGVPTANHPLASHLSEAGFVSGALGMTPRPQTPSAARPSMFPRRPSRRLLSSPFSPRNFVDPEDDRET
jgi:ATP-dependent Lhr-like helicase